MPPIPSPEAPPPASRPGDRLEAASVTFAFSGARAEGRRAIPVETPVQVTYGNLPFGVMMLTPRNLDDFAYGFSLTEGVIERVEDVRGIAVDTLPDGLRLRIDLTGARLHAHLARKRAMTGRTSCGLCGVEDLGALPRARAAPSPAPPVSLAALARALAALDAHQPLNAATRAVHGAAWCAADGAIRAVREDVGRHNALDKLFGALLRDGEAPGDGFALITSRASFEMVEKAGTFRARTLVAISAPSALAVERATALDLTLIGIARADSVTAFHGAGRIVP